VALEDIDEAWDERKSKTKGILRSGSLHPHDYIRCYHGDIEL
jgi:hypothetical protein